MQLTANDFVDIDQAWNEAVEPEGSYSNVPDGKYRVKIDVCRPGYTNLTMKRKCAWEFTIMDGEYAGRKLFHNHMLETIQNFGWFKKDLRVCGIDTNAPDFVPSQFLAGGNEILIGRIINVSVKNVQDKNDKDKINCNIYFLEDRVPGKSNFGNANNPNPANPNVQQVAAPEAAFANPWEA